MAGGGDLGLPPGPWVLVTGMHRSGTSALTGALGRLGLSVPAATDLVSGRYDNPVHYESAALTALNDDALTLLRGSWSAPPALEAGWEHAPALAPLRAPAARAARRAFPGQGPLVWKDPRLCLLLPWWRTLLPAPLAVVLVWRAPAAVARSLGERQGFVPSLALALWDRYARAALAALEGHDAYVLRYEQLVAQPASELEAVRAWLRSRAVAVDDTDAALGEAAASVSPGPARRAEGGSDDGALGRAVEALDALRGGHEHLRAPPLPDPPSWMADAVGQRHEYEDLYMRYMRYVRWRRRIPVLGRAARRRG